MSQVIVLPESPIKPGNSMPKSQKAAGIDATEIVAFKYSVVFFE